jgi:hypothetical protein
MAVTATRSASGASIRWSRSDVLGLVAMTLAAMILSAPASWRGAVADLVLPDAAPAPAR